MRNRSRLARPVLIAGSALSLALGGAAFAPGVANAGDYNAVVFQGDDYAALSPGMYYGEVCDIERDGHAVHASFWVDSGIKVVTDANGSKPGCSKTGNMHSAIYKVQVCEEVVGPDWCEEWPA